jgi:hypothetical protein
MLAAAFGETGLIVLGVPVADGGEAGASLLGNESLAGLLGVDVVVASGAVVVAGVGLLSGEGAREAASGGNGHEGREDTELEHFTSDRAKSTQGPPSLPNVTPFAGP